MLATTPLPNEETDPSTSAAIRFDQAARSIQFRRCAARTGQFPGAKISNSYPLNKAFPKNREISRFSHDCLQHNGTGGVDAGYHHNATA